mgnify:CR=1 FL=1
MRRFRLAGTVPAGLLLIAAALPALLGCTEGASPPPFDIVIKGGTLYDGSNAPSRTADIGIRGDRIIAIGDIAAKSEKSLDARGLIITPGFIDSHSHFDIAVREVGWRIHLADWRGVWKGNHAQLLQGVTTVITGNCGMGHPDAKAWLEQVDALKMGVNVGHLAPYGAIRNELFDNRADAPLVGAEVESFRRRMDAEMQRGALGMSIGLHRMPDGLATADEVVEIAATVKNYGGVLSVHLRNDSGRLQDHGQAAVVESLAEAIGIGLRSGAPLHISQIRLRLPFTDVRSSQMRRMVEEARKSGLDVTADQSPYEATIDPLPARLPAGLLSGAALRSEYRSGEAPEALKRAVDELLLVRKPERILIVSFPGDRSLEGRTIREIATKQKKTAAEVCLALLRGDPAPVAAFFETNDKVMRALMPFPWVFTASHAVPSFSGDVTVPPSYYGTFPRKIRKYAIEDKIIRLNDAIRSMTSAPAEKFGLQGRGRLAVGNYADIAVIDLKNFADAATYGELQKPARGVVHLLVNGIVSVEGGKVTGHRGGRAIRRF